ncbi:MAG: MATE family efflux transporter [Bacteroidales bacterium]|jgi:putative MATE family efflux protein|nr:MATE family efflux transporter [Bacteroidales bacterium]
MNERITYKRIFAIAFPIILSQLAQSIVAIADTMFLGNVGETELAAAALGTIFYQVFFMFLWGFGVGTQITIARVRGENHEKSIGRIFQHSIFFMLCASLIILLLYHIFGKMLMGTLISSGPILNAAIEYLDARVWGYPFAFIGISFMAFYIGIARTNIISYAAIAIGIVNIIGDYLLIFGNGGFPEMGMAGAAWASVFSEIVWVIIFFAASTIKNNNRYRLYKRFPLHKPLFGRLFKISYPTMLQFLFSFGTYFCFLILIEGMGQRSLAIANITRSCYTIFLLPIWGFTSTVASLTAYLLGRDRTAQKTQKNGIHVNHLINTLVWKSTLLGFACITVILLPFFIFSNTLLGLFTQDISLVYDSMDALLVISIAAYLMCIAQVIFNVVIGYEKTKQAFTIEMITIAFYILYAWIIIKQLHCSIAVAWTTEYLYTLLIFLLSVCYLLWIRRRRSIAVNN